MKFGNVLKGRAGGASSKNNNNTQQHYHNSSSWSGEMEQQSIDTHSTTSRTRSISPFKRPLSPFKNRRAASPVKRTVSPNKSRRNTKKQDSPPEERGSDSLRNRQRYGESSRSRRSSRSKSSSRRLQVSDQTLHDELDHLVSLQPEEGTTIRIVPQTNNTQSQEAQLVSLSSSLDSPLNAATPTQQQRVTRTITPPHQNSAPSSGHLAKGGADPVLAVGNKSGRGRGLFKGIRKSLQPQTRQPQSFQQPQQRHQNSTQQQQQQQQGLVSNHGSSTSSGGVSWRQHPQRATSPRKQRSPSPKKRTLDSEYQLAAANVTPLGKHEVRIYTDAGNLSKGTDKHVPEEQHAFDPQPYLSAVAANSNTPNSPGRGGILNDLDDACGPNGSISGSLTLGSCSRTQVAGNLTMTPSSLLLSGVVTLSLMRTPTNVLISEEDNVNANTPKGKGGAVSDPASKFAFMSSSARTVQESLERHIQFHLCRSIEKNRKKNNGPGRGPLGSFDNSWTNAPSYSLDSASLFDTAGSHTEKSDTHEAAQECLRKGDVDAAIAIYKNALQKQQETREKVIFHTVTSAGGQLDTLERVETLCKMSVLLLYAGRNQQAMESANEASSLILKDNPLADTRPLQAIMVTMSVGLIHFSTNRSSKALQSWRQTIQTCAKTLGYDHPINSVLMNNIGVLHVESGDTMAAFKALEESLHLQRALLKNGSLIDTDYSLHQMATTMSNLAMVLELQEEHNSAINYLQEAQALFESVEGDSDNVVDYGNRQMNIGSSYHKKIQRIVIHHLERLHVARQEYLDRRIRNAPSTLLESGSMETDASSIDSEDPEVTEDAIMASLVEKRSRNNKHVLQQGHRKKLHLSDIYDYILLGSIRSEWTPRERVRETVLAWFGRPSAKTNAKSILPSIFGVKAGAKTLISPPDFNVGFEDGGPSHLLSQAKRNASHKANPTNDEIEMAFSEVRDEIMDLVAQENTAKAMDVCVAALEDYKATFSKDHGLVGTALHMAGMLHLLAEEYLQAYGVLKEAAMVRKTVHGTDDAKVASSLMKLALLQYAAMDIPAAGRTMGEIRGTYLKVMGFGHPHLAQIMNNIGILRYEQGDIGAAIRALEIAYEYQRKIIEDGVKEAEENQEYIDLDHSQVAEVVMAYTLSNIAFLYYHKDDHMSSLRLYEEAKGILSRHAPPSDRVMLQIQDSIECLMGRGVDMVPCDDRMCIMKGQNGSFVQRAAQCTSSGVNPVLKWSKKS